MHIISTQPSLNSVQANNIGGTASTPSTDPKQSSDNNVQNDSPVNVKVSLSTQGLKKSAEANSNDDIEQSGLPDKAQKLLKMIRELKKQIEEKMKSYVRSLQINHLQMRKNAQGWEQYKQQWRP